MEGRAGEGVKSESLVVVGCNSEQGPMCSDIDILGTRCKENRVACWSLELCAICKVVDVGSKVCRGSWTWSGRKHPVGRYRAASGVLEFKDRQRRLRVPGFPFAPCRRALHRRDGRAWLSDATLRRIAAMPLENLPSDDGWITESINWGRISGRKNTKYGSRSLYY